MKLTGEFVEELTTGRIHEEAPRLRCIQDNIANMDVGTKYLGYLLT